MPTGSRSRIGRASCVARAASPLLAARTGTSCGRGGGTSAGSPASSLLPLGLGPFFSRSFNSRASSWKAECSPGLSAGAGSLLRGGAGSSTAGAGGAGVSATGMRNGSTLAGMSGSGGGCGCARRCSIAATCSMSRQMPKPRKPAKPRSRSNTGRPDISTARRSPPSSTGQRTTMPLQVFCAASASATSLPASSLSAAAILFQGQLSSAAVFGPSSREKVSATWMKRPVASICQTKRKGDRFACVGTMAGAAATSGASAARASGAAAAAAAVNIMSRKNFASAPSLSSVTRPAAISPSARPLSVASRASFSAPSAIRSRLSASRACTSGLPSTHSPSAVNSAAGKSRSRRMRRARSAATNSWPARSVDTTRMPVPLLANVRREHRQISVPPRLAPKPRSRSSRAALPCGSVPASRATCTAAGCLASKRKAATAAGEVASKIAAPVGFAHSMRLASALHSQTGCGLMACGASRASLSQAIWFSVPVIPASLAWIRANELLIRPGTGGVHDAREAIPIAVLLALIAPSSIWRSHAIALDRG